MFSLKGQTVNILGSEGQMVSISITLLCSNSVFSKTILFPKQVAGRIRPVGNGVPTHSQVFFLDLNSSSEQRYMITKYNKTKQTNKQTNKKLQLFPAQIGLLSPIHRLTHSLGLQEWGSQSLSPPCHCTSRSLPVYNIKNYLRKRQLAPIVKNSKRKSLYLRL